jgi:PAS domain S-box-containing protein
VLHRRPDGVLAVVRAALGTGRPRRRVVALHLDEDTRGVLEACSDAVLGIDEDGVCVVVNGAAAAVFGTDRNQLVGLGAAELLPGLADAVRRITARRRAGDAVPGTAGEGIETTGRRRNGSTFPATVWIAPAYPQAGRLTLFTTVRDLTGRRAAAAAHRALLEDVAQLRDTVEALTTAVRDRAILLADPEGHVTAINRAAEKLLGYRPEDLVGKPTTALSDPQDLAAVRAELGMAGRSDPLLELTRSGLPNRQRWTLLTRDGERRPVTLTITGIGDRDAAGGFVLVVAPRRSEWDPLVKPRRSGDRLLLDLDDAETRTLSWQVGGSGARRR